MEIRHIKPEENVLSSMLRSRVFLSSQPADFTERLNNPLEHTGGYENVWACFDDDGEMASTMVVTPYNLMFDGHVVGMGGIGGVATLPEARAGGYVRKTFEKCIPEMYERGMVFSFLYPFSHEFYRKFGYEHSQTVYEAVIPMTALEAYPRPKRVSFYNKGGDISGIKAVYESFTADKNLAAVRSDDAFRHMLDKDPYSTKQYTYVHHGEDAPDCYVIYKPNLNGDGNTVNIMELAWSRVSGLHGILGFLAGLKPQFKNIKWEVPGCVNVFSLFPECYNINLHSRASGMNRIVNLQKTLELMRYPSCAGQSAISVTDKFFPHNTGLYWLEWDKGVGTVKKVSNSPDENADMVTDIETMAQLVIGYMTPAETLFKDTMKINGNMDALTALFPKKTLYLYEKF